MFDVKMFKTRVRAARAAMKELGGAVRALADDYRRLDRAVVCEPSLDDIIVSLRRTAAAADGKPAAQADAETLAESRAVGDAAMVLEAARRLRADPPGDRATAWPAALALLLRIAPDDPRAALERAFADDVPAAQAWAAGTENGGGRVTRRLVSAVAATLRQVADAPRRDPADWAALRILHHVEDPALRARCLDRLAADPDPRRRRVAETATRAPDPAEIVARLKKWEMRALLMAVPPETLAQFLAYAPAAAPAVCAAVDPRAADWLRAEAAAARKKPDPAARIAARAAVADALIAAVERGDIRWPLGLPPLRPLGQPSLTGAAPKPSDAAPSPPETPAAPLPLTPPPSSSSVAPRSMAGVIYLSLAASGWAAAAQATGARLEVWGPTIPGGMIVLLSAALIALIGEEPLRTAAARLCLAAQAVGLCALTWLLMFGVADPAPLVPALALAALAASAGARDGMAATAFTGAALAGVATAVWLPPAGQTAVFGVATFILAWRVGCLLRDGLARLRGKS